MNRRARGQSLLEALIALALVALLLSAAFAALGVTTRAKGADEGRASAANAAANAAAELRAATEYDVDALAAVGNATWIVLPPSPPPGAAPADAGPITLSTSVRPDGAGVAVGLSFASAKANGATTLFLQQYAPAPGSDVFRIGATPVPSP
jgi:type II secretory pathway pseudopilin PulG